jgi:hypothetical protein
MTLSLGEVLCGESEGEREKVRKSEDKSLSKLGDFLYIYSYLLRTRTMSIEVPMVDFRSQVEKK